MSGAHIHSIVCLSTLLFGVTVGAACLSRPESRKSADQDAVPAAPAIQPASDATQWPPFRCDAASAHTQSNAVARLSSDDRGPNDCPLYDLSLYSDGCYYIRYMGPPGLTRTGRVGERFVSKLAQDAETYAIESFEDDLRLRDDYGCPITLTLDLNGRQKRIRFDQLVQPYDYERAMDRGADFLLRLVIVDLISKRLDDLMYSSE